MSVRFSIQAFLAALALFAGAAGACARQDEPAFTVALPVLVDGRRVGALEVETTVRTLIAVPPAALAARLDTVLSAAARADLEALGAAPVAVEQITALGLGLALDPQALTIEVTLPPALRAARVASLEGDWAARGEAAIRPQGGAAAVTAALSLFDTLNDGRDPAVELDLDGFANFGGYGGISLDAGGRFILRPDGDSRFERRPVYAFKDDPARARRWSAGELTADLGGRAGAVSVLGAAYAIDPQGLQPARNIRPAGARSLVLERRSTVEVFVNGVLVDRFSAEPGPVELADIPAANLSNDVVIVVEDAFGRREADRFQVSADVSLLRPGLSEAVLIAGAARRERDGGVSYDLDRPVLGARYVRGLSPTLTGGGAAAVSEEVAVAGLVAARAGFGGVVQAGLTASRSDAAGAGAAASLEFRGGPYLAERNAVVAMRLETLSEDFASFDDPESFSDLAWSAGGDVRFDVSDTVSATLAAFAEGRHGRESGALSLSAGLDRRIGAVAVSASVRHTRFADRDAQTGVFFTVSRRLGARSSAAASYDSFTDTSRLEVRRAGRAGPGWGAARAAAVHRDAATELSVSVSGETKRAALRLDADHRTAADGAPERTSFSARAQTGLAYSGGRLGVGVDPGDGFVMVERHASLRGAEIAVRRGSADQAAGAADRLGPAVIAMAAPYRVQRLQVDARDLPAGYDLGPGAYDVEPGALTGVAIMVGRAAYRTAVATLLREGEPVVLRLGTLTRLDTGETQSFFTNRAGRAAFNALAPGRYEARLDGRAALGFTFEINEESEAYVRLGDINLAPDR
ncbi:MAG: fimbria/pilus outer membrane usher protein [Oceanicaulis sp.]